MPTTYTHYAYGQEVFHMLPDKIQKAILPHIAYYNIGVHGPDILFYYHSFCRNEVNQYGVKIHHEAMKHFLCHAFCVYVAQGKKPEAFAYLAGFMTHFILDSTCHPYIRKRIRQTGISHTEIETDWDALMMHRDHLSPFAHKTACHVRAFRKYAKVIAPYYDKTTYQLQASLFDMRFVLNHVFRSPFGLKRNMVSLINEVFFPKMHFQHYMIKKHPNSKNKKTVKQLRQLYRGSKKECVGEIVGLYEALLENDLSFCRKKRFEKNFS